MRALLVAACVAASTTVAGAAAAEVGNPAPGTCKYAGFVAHGSPATLYGIQPDTGEREQIGPSGQTYNAMGYNRLDGKIYATQPNGSIVTVDPASGAVLATISVKPGAKGKYPLDHYYQGDVTPDGRLWYVRSSNSFHVVNVDPASSAYLTYEKTVPVDLPGIFDFSFHPADGKIYTASANKIIRVNPVTGAAATLGTIPHNATWGGQFFDSTGNLYLSANEGYLVKVDLTQLEDGRATLGSAAKLSSRHPALGHNDGAPCVGGTITPPYQPAEPDPYSAPPVAPNPYATPN